MLEELSAVNRVSVSPYYIINVCLFVCATTRAVFILRPSTSATRVLRQGRRSLINRRINRNYKLVLVAIRSRCLECFNPIALMPSCRIDSIKKNKTFARISREERVSFLKSPTEMDWTWATPTECASDHSLHKVTNLISLSISVSPHSAR